ncbi:MAG: hypothetical protein GY866_25495 [Proteobacteria bacterium]|nr:hypothetical protein [Pseudomonadota bacterium]
MRKKIKKQKLTDEAICDATYEAIRQAGWIIPTDEASVAKAEALLANDMPDLPPKLRDLEFPSAADNPSAGKVVPLWDPEVLSAPMARAAREGGEISPEVERIMKHDREIAERELLDRKRDDSIDKENDDG